MPDTYRAYIQYGVIMLLVSAGILSRAYGLGHWSYAMDEFFTIQHAAERMTNPTNPAYYALVTASFSCFGPSEFAARLPAFLLGVVAIPVFMMIWKKEIGMATALSATVFLIMSVWVLDLSQYARFYSGVFLFGGLGYYLFWFAATTGQKRYFTGSLLCQLIAIAFHATALLIPVSLTVFSFLLFLKTRNASDERFSKKIVIAYLIMMFMGMLIVLPPAINLLKFWNQTKQSWGYSHLSFILQIVKYAQIPILSAAFFGIFFMLKNDPWKAIFHLCGICVPVLILTACSPFMSVRPDYMFYTMPLILGLSGYFIQVLFLSSKSIKMSVAVTLLVVATLSPEFISYYLGKITLTIKDAAAAIEAKYEPDDLVLSLVPGINFYASEQFKTAPFMGDIFDQSIDWQRELNEKLPKNNRVWILVPISRRTIAFGLEQWLMNNTNLVWRKFSKRYDYSIEGFELYLKKKSDRN